MKIDFEIPFICDDAIRPHLQRVFAGEYDVRIAFPGGRRIIDLGANCGSFALWAAHRWPGSAIYSYEPHPETFEILMQNTKNYPQVMIHNWGIGTPGLRILRDGLYNSGEASFHVMTDNEAPTGRHLEVRDPLSLPEADIIKLDIEGCELEALSPLIGAGRKFDLILLEYHNESLRRGVDSLLKDYTLIGSEVQHIYGRGVSKYLRNELHRELFR